MRLHDLVAIAVLGALAVAPALPARAAGAWMSIEQDVLEPGQKVTLVVVPDDDLWRMEISVVRDDGKTQRFEAGRTPAGQRLTFTWRQEEGEHAYDVSALLVDPEGFKETVEDSYSVVVAGPFEASIPADAVDLDARTFQLVSNRPVATVRLEILDEELQTVGKETLRITDSVKGQPTTVQWSEVDSEYPIFRISVRAYGPWQFWADNEIIPWSLAIPHEEVNFATNQYDITDEEAPKLDHAYEEIVAAVEKYGEFVQCRLFIAGYTDTVGDPGSNQTLSNNRARSIAKYFQGKGFQFPIFYQGFGESVLAVPTGDSVDELANRRALYIIAANQPPKTQDVPRGNWTRLQ